MKRLKIQAGDKFNKLTIVNPFYGQNKHSNNLCECICDCGKTTILSAHQITSGKTKSCGCLKTRRRAGRFSGCGEIYGEFWYHIQYNAKRRKIKFDISIEDAWSLFLKQNRKCAISGLPLTFHSASKVWDGNASLDRIDSTKGYVSGNIQWLHKDINWMKQDYSQREFVNYCRAVANNNPVI